MTAYKRVAIVGVLALCFAPTQVNKADDKSKLVPCLQQPDPSKCWHEADVEMVKKLLKLHDPRVDKILQEYFFKVGGLKMEPPPKVKR